MMTLCYKFALIVTINAVLLAVFHCGGGAALQDWATLVQSLVETGCTWTAQVQVSMALTLVLPVLVWFAKFPGREMKLIWFLT